MNLYMILCLVFVVVAVSAAKEEFCAAACGVIALIPARGGSKGFPNKNLAPLEGKSLLCRSIDIAKKSKAFTSIWVSTDWDRIAKEATKCGAQVHMRSEESASDTATTLSVVQDFLASHSEITAVAIIQCTSPLICPHDLQDAAKLFKDPKTDCVFSATRSHKLRWKLGAGRYGIPENFDPKARPRRQDWSGELLENGMFYFSTRELIENGTLQNDRCRIAEIPKRRSLEIDSGEDLEFARIVSPFVSKCE